MKRNVLLNAQLNSTNIFYHDEISAWEKKLAATNQFYLDSMKKFAAATNTLEEYNQLYYRFNFLNYWGYKFYKMSNYADSARYLSLAMEAEKSFSELAPSSSTFLPVYYASCLMTNQTPQRLDKFRNSLIEMLSAHAGNKKLLWENRYFLLNDVKPNIPVEAWHYVSNAVAYIDGACTNEYGITVPQ